MGTKKRLAPMVAEILKESTDGPFLDGFSGMCAVGAAVGQSRQVWNNDVQLFATKVAAAMFTYGKLPPPVLSAGTISFVHFDDNRRSLQKELSERLKEEEEALKSSAIRTLNHYYKKWRVGVSDPLTDSVRSKYARHKSKRPFKLFTLLYADTYLGLSQCIEIDSIVFSIKRLLSEEIITVQEQDWMLLALGQSMLKCSTTVGHFAQYLEPNSANLKRYLAQRNRSIREEWLSCLSSLSPIGTVSWRKRNHVFRGDCVALLNSFSKRRRNKPSVVYADPPYTDDQYSRYYHILETLFFYDYPKIAAKGRYRPDRFQTQFSKRATAVQAFKDLAKATASIGAQLILSYPANGLLQKIGTEPSSILKDFFKKVNIVHSIPYAHSTFGASNGKAKAHATEIIYSALP